MADKDKVKKILEDYNDVFADIYNTLLFREKLLDESLLLAGPTESIYKSEVGVNREQRRDILKYYNGESGLLLCSYGIENQITIEDHMPLRVMGYDYATYRDSERRERHALLPPVITIVLNFTDKKWDKAKSFH